MPVRRVTKNSFFLSSFLFSTLHVYLGGFLFWFYDKHSSFLSFCLLLFPLSVFLCCFLFRFCGKQKPEKKAMLVRREAMYISFNFLCLFLSLYVLFCLFIYFSVSSCTCLDSVASRSPRRRQCWYGGKQCISINFLCLFLSLYALFCLFIYFSVSSCIFLDSVASRSPRRRQCWYDGKQCRSSGKGLSPGRIPLTGQWI